MPVVQIQPARKKVVKTKTGLNFVISFNFWRNEISAILFSLPNVRKFSTPPLPIVKNEQQREVMATEACHQVETSPTLRLSAGVQMTAKKIMAIWKADSYWASLKRKI